MPFPCPLCTLMQEDYYTALAEAGHASHRDEADLLLDYAEEVRMTLERHINSHVVTAADAPTQPLSLKEAHQ